MIKQLNPAPGLIPALVIALAGCSGESDPAPVSASWQHLDAAGEVMTESPAGGHHCVFDPRTGLTWEVKRAARGPHRVDATWSWYSDQRHLNLSEPGLENGGDCDLERCDTSGLIEAVNETGGCGHHDWRLPTRDELLTLIDGHRIKSGNGLDRAFFPAAPAGEYWSASTFRMYPQSAWLVDTRTGLDRAEFKREARFVRLVRGDVFDPRAPR